MIQVRIAEKGGDVISHCRANLVDFDKRLMRRVKIGIGIQRCHHCLDRSVMKRQQTRRCLSNLSYAKRIDKAFKANFAPNSNG